MHIPNAHWSIEKTPLGQIITYKPRGGSGYLLSWASVVGLGLFCGYWVQVFLRGWFVDGEEILPAGIIFFLGMLGGFLFALRSVFHLLRVVRYTLGASTMKVETATLLKAKSETIERDRIEKIMRLYTPAKSAGQKGSYTTLLIVNRPQSKKNSMALEGWLEEEQIWLSTLLADWCGKPLDQENTAH